MRVLRSLIAVVAGYLVFALSAVALFRLAGRKPHAPQPLWFVLTAIASGVLGRKISRIMGSPEWLRQRAE